MVIILVLLTILLAISIELLRHRMARTKEEVPLTLTEERNVSISSVLSGHTKSNGLYFPKEYYYHNGHAWVKLEEKDLVKIGVDDLTQKIMGNIEEIEPPAPGKKLNQGEVVWKIRHGQRKLKQLSPLGGTVIEVNEKLIKDPSLINRSPYEEGWILKIKPKALAEELPKLMDSLQMKIHFDQMKAKLRSSFNHENLGTVYGDGEEILSCAAEKLDERWWRILVTQLFRSSPE